MGLTGPTVASDPCGQVGPETGGQGGTKNALRSSGGAASQHRSQGRADSGEDRRDHPEPTPVSRESVPEARLLSAATLGRNHGFTPTRGGHPPVGVRVVNSGSKWKVSSGLPTAGLKGGLISFLYSFCGESGGVRGEG